MSRLPVKKTYKLFVGGEFPRSESGRTYEAEGQNVARGSRKDLRDAVRAARGAFPKWAGMTAYNRGQVLYRVAEMMEARRSEFADLCSGPKEVDRSIDRFVWYAGFADKLAQVLGTSNPVAGPYFNFTVPESRGSSRASRRLSSAATPSSRSRPSRTRSPRSSWPRRWPRRTSPAASSTSLRACARSSRRGWPGTWT